MIGGRIPSAGHYRGWEIGRGPDHPATGRWRARRFGVGMSAGTEEQLRRMIDARVTDEEKARGRPGA